MPTPPLDLDFVRSRFPGLKSPWVFFDNGGGSQILDSVLDRTREYLTTSNVQHGASYEVSRLAAERVDEAQRAMATFVHARDPSEVVIGPSTSALLRTLARSLAARFQPGDQVIVSEADHEANVGPWVELERHGVEVRTWRIRPDEPTLSLDDLDALLTPKTRLVAVTHTSNLLGEIVPVRAVADLTHERGALVCVDGVAYAPHRAVDVRALGVDFYAFSFYKTFGPHQALLWGRREHLVELPGENHFFIAEDDVPYKFQPGGVNYEQVYGLLGITDYLADVARRGVTADPPGSIDTGAVERDAPGRDLLETAFDAIARHEETLAAKLLDDLVGRPGVRVVGPTSPDRRLRTPIVSFVVDGRAGSDVVARVDDHRIGIRFGHFYSPRLVEALGLPLEDGVVRVSMAHYNTAAEVDRLLDALDTIL